MRRLQDFLINSLYGEESEENRLLDRKRTDGKIPVNNVGFLSYVFVSWMTPLILRNFKHRERELKEEDLWQCSDQESAAANTLRLEIIWEKEKQTYGKNDSSFLRVWLKFIRIRLIILLIGATVNTILTFLMTGFITNLIVSYIESDESNAFYAAGLLISNFVGQILRTCSFCFLLFFGGHTGIRFRAGVLGLVYKKLLKLKNLKGGTFSEIVTIFGSDSQRVLTNCQMFAFILAVPLYLGIGAAYTYYLIGPWCFVAIGIFAFFYQLQAIFTTLITKLRRKTLVWTDKRIRMLTEILNSMKMIKMYAWEEPFEKSVKIARSKETKVLRIIAILTFIISGMIPVAPTLASVATIAAYASLGNKLEAATAFSVVSTLNCMRLMVSLLPIATRIFGETRVSFERIKRVLLQEEYQTPSRNVLNDRNAIEIEDGVFQWESGNVPDEQISGSKNEFSSDDEDLRADRCSLELNVIDLNIKKGTLTGICGGVGCGKSSLISAILGRMPNLSGYLAVKGSVAYAAQEAWIFNGTIKENILFGRSYEPDWYAKVIYACGLLPDLELFPCSDETEIGDKGKNISGGQKQRISLARAVYSKCDIYLLDDPLSAVDVHVGKHLFQECINKLLKKKTVILVTHQLQYLEFCDRILVMADGKIVEKGAHDYLWKKGGKYRAMKEQFNLTMSDTEITESNEMIREQDQSSSKETKEQWNPDKYEINSDLKSGKGTLTRKEKVATGSVGINTYKSYVSAAGGICVAGIVLLIYVVTTGSAVFSEWWLGIWIQHTTSRTFKISRNESMRKMRSSLNIPSRNTNTTSTIGSSQQGGIDLYIMIYIGSVVAMVIFTVLQGFVSGTVLIGASKRLHNRALSRIIQAPMSFFDANPTGRIINRFSRDIEEGDVYIPVFLDIALQMTLTIVLSLVSTAITLPWILFAFVFTSAIFLVLKNVSAVSIRQLKRFENIARSPLLNHVTTTGKGLSTIVSYKQQDVFINRCMKYSDATSVGLLLLEASTRWTGLRFDLVASMLAVAAAVIIVLTKGALPAALAALALTLCIKVTSVVEYLVQLLNELESRFTSIERMHEYECLETEKEMPNMRPDDNWPSEGCITFSNIAMKYRSDMDLVLRNINFDVPHRQKVGIVGRTGAGKSSLAAALFRLTELSSGHVYIDGVDIALIPRRILRSKLSVIPQEPVLFAGTLRYNLDPFGQHSDYELWSVLEQVHIKEKMQDFNIYLDLNLDENGEIFSVGERQLICLARAILRRNKVLILDEATASVDTETDTMIQHTIKDSFSDCTVLTIAHRLNTVLHCDVIFVMESGRIVENGGPQDLLSNPSSHFSKMVRSQTLKTQDIY